jgi:hypothetical protein
MPDTDELVERLRAIEEHLRELAYDRLRAAAEDGDADAEAEERKIQKARRAVEKAIGALGGEPDVF